MVVCQHNLERFKDPDHAEGGRLFDHEVDKAAGKIVSGLSLARLVELENKTNAMLRSGQPVDGEFWDLVLKKIHVEKAIVRNLESTSSGCSLTGTVQAKLDTRSGVEKSARAI